MEGDMDDFGDIYADVEGYVNAGVCMIPSIRQLYLEDQAKAEPSPGDSEEEERLLYDRIGRGRLPDGSPGSAAVAVSDGSVGKPPAECAGGGGDDVVGEESNDSDSDDDLRIVLNEEDCNKFVPLPSVGLGNGGLLAGVDTNEEAKDESIIKNGVKHTSKEHKSADLSQVPVEGLEQSSLERGGSLKSGFVMPYSQFKEA
ncbi:hypothetical protein Taro_038729 [Colocasia esculenta]|uniref:Uncharacterized protein n=1 Tax=Colocasia esculenta TaxID=4460 RepID=A0A843WK39_COLES|nr:hypothetical protein [Colocasia esculenta]